MTDGRGGAVVTGAGRGLGRAIAELLADRGHQVLAARDAILEHAGHLDVWVNNAGGLVTGPAWEQQPEQVVDAVGRVLDRPCLVTSVPAWRGLQARLADAFPEIGLRVVPMVVGMGKRQQAKYRKNCVPE